MNQEGASAFLNHETPDPGVYCLLGGDLLFLLLGDCISGCLLLWSLVVVERASGLVKGLGRVLVGGGFPGAGRLELDRWFGGKEG